MRDRSRSRYFVTDVLVFVVVAVVVLVLGLTAGGANRSEKTVRVIVRNDDPQAGRSIPSGFLGLSLEYAAVAHYAGSDPQRVDPVLVQLIRNLAPGQAPSLRIGGDSTDWTWWPVPGLARPPGVTFTLDQRYLAVLRTLADETGARLLLGINFEADSGEVAAAEARALTGALGSARVQALELGNEPELYGAFPWYHTADGRGVRGRPQSYDFASYKRDFAAIAAALPTSPLAGPSLSGTGWTTELAQFLAAVPHLAVVTLHKYPMQLCYVSRASPRYPSVANLLSDNASRGMAAGLEPYVAIAHARGFPLRLDELNSVACGAVPAVSQTFAAALWALDTSFELVRAGFDGINFHTFPGAGYELFRLSSASGRWQATVSPQYYGLLMFARATPPGSRLLPVSGSGGSAKVWATATSDGWLRIVLINKDQHASRRVALRLSAARGAGTLERLEAPGAAARSGVTLAGRGFAEPTATGALPGPPQATVVKPTAGTYVITLPPASAALLTLAPS